MRLTVQARPGAFREEPLVLVDTASQESSELLLLELPVLLLVSRLLRPRAVLRPSGS
jgi:hypothetical protein